MYKKITLLTSLFWIISNHASYLAPWLEIKPSYFLFTSAPMKDIYHKGGFQVQASTSIRVNYHLDLYGSIGYRESWGHALNTYEQTSLTIVPIDIGLKPIFNWGERGYYFFAIGPRFFYLQQKNQSPYVDSKIKAGSVGLFVNTGINFLLRNHFLLGIFGEYSYEKKTIYPNMLNVFSGGPTQVGGFAIGLNLGYAF